MTLKRYAEAVWNGDLQTGQGALSTPQSGLFEAQEYSFKSRFGDHKGTNPEELLATAHAGCFSMALSAMLGRQGFEVDSIQTRAEVSMDPGVQPGPTITDVRLMVSAQVPGIDPARFEEIAGQAKAGCVISRALAVPVTLQANLIR